MTDSALSVAADEVIADLCELAEEQPGNPHDELSTRLYEIANKLELAKEAERAGA